MSHAGALQTLTAPEGFEDVLKALLVLNLVDALATLAWVEAGLATEANPVMAGALFLGPGLFILAKLALVTLAVGLLYRQRGHASARLATIPAALLYAFVGGGHLGFLARTGVSAGLGG